MTPDHDFDDDAILSRVARARPPVSDDLSPASPRAAAIADRITASPRTAPSRWARRRADRSARARSQLRRRPGTVFGTGGLTLAAICTAIVLTLTGTFSGSGAAPAVAAVIHVHITTSQLSPKENTAFDSTQLGRTIHAQTKIQENITTGALAENEKAITSLTTNRLACLKAARAVAAVSVPATGLQHTVQTFWVTGIRLQAVGDQQLIDALQAYDSGHKTAGKHAIDAASETLDADDVLTGWSEIALYAPPADPKPELPDLAPAAQRVVDASGLKLRRSGVK